MADVQKTKERELTLDELKDMLKDELGEQGREMGEEVEELKSKMAQQEETIAEQNKILSKVDRTFSEGLMGDGKRVGELTNPVGRMLRHLIAAKGDPDMLIATAEKRNDKQFLNWVERSLTAGDTGASLVPIEYLGGELIKSLKEDSAFMAAGPRRVPLPAGNASIPKQSGSATFSWVGESEDVNASAPEYKGMVRLEAKKGFAIVPVSNDMLHYTAGPDIEDADSLISDDIRSGIGEGLDTALLRSTGSENRPKGLRYLAPTAHVNERTQAGTSSTLAEIFADLVNAVKLPRASKIKVQRGAWFLHPNTKWGMISRLNANGDLSFLAQALIQSNTLLSWPVYDSTMIPVDLGAGSDESEVIFADMSQILLGVSRDIAIEVLAKGAAYVDANGTVRASASRDETVVQAIVKLDMKPRFDEAISVITTVDW